MDVLGQIIPECTQEWLNTWTGLEIIQKMDVIAVIKLYTTMAMIFSNISINSQRKITMNELNDV